MHLVSGAGVSLLPPQLRYNSNGDKQVVGGVLHPSANITPIADGSPIWSVTGNSCIPDRGVIINCQLFRNTGVDQVGVLFKNDGNALYMSNSYNIFNGDVIHTYDILFVPTVSYT